MTQTSDDYWLQNLFRRIKEKKDLRNKIGLSARENKKIILGRGEVRLLAEMLYDWREGNN